MNPCVEVCANEGHPGHAYTDTVQRDLGAAYRERNAVVAALIRTNGWAPVMVPAPDAPGWFILYADTPEGQVSWHIPSSDTDLFTDAPVVSGWRWDGHLTQEKYERLSRLGR